MNIQDILRRYPAIGRDRLKLNEDLSLAIKAQLNADGNIKCSIISDMPRGTMTSDPTYSATENLFEHLEEICIELANAAEYTKLQIRELDDMQKQVDEGLLYLTYDEKRIVDLRYWQYPEPKYTWNKVISESFYCERQCFEIHRKALEKLERRVNIAVKRSKQAV